MKDKNLQLVQVLRGFAALLVVLFHATANSNEVLNATFIFNFFYFGGAGVDIFFVLSGFIITYTSLKYIERRKSLPSFLYRRFVRIFPTYWIIITIFLLLQILLPSFYKTNYNFNIGNILNTYLLLPGHTMVNGVSWTLTFELFFYFLFSFTFIIGNKKAAFVCATIYSITLILLIIHTYKYKNDNMWLGLTTFPMNLEFFLGVLVAGLSYIPNKFNIVFIVLGSVCFIASGVALNNGFQLFTNPFNRVVLFGIPSFFIVLGCIKYERAKVISAPKILLKLGDASYSLYLIHLPLMAACCKIILRLNITNHVWQNIILLLFILMVCLGSILFYIIIEKPIISKLNTLRKIKVAAEI